MRITYTSAQLRKLRNLGIRPFDELIHDQPKKWLIENFSEGATTYPVNVTRLMFNIIWQTRERIVAGEKPLLRELIRTYWYMYIKPTLSRCDSLSDKPDDQYRAMVDRFTDLVKTHRIMEYKDFGFRDVSRNNRLVGENGNIIIFAEKEGHMDILMDLNNQYRVSVIALGGWPSVLNNEYFTDELKEKVHLNSSFYLFGICDFDPFGRFIRYDFISNLERYGIKNIKVVDLVHPDMLTAEEVKHSRYRLSTRTKRNRTITEEWFGEVTKKNYRNLKHLKETRRAGKKTETIYYGIESRAVSTKRIAEKLKELVLPILGKSEDYLREYELSELDRALGELILFKIRRGER